MLEFDDDEGVVSGLGGFRRTASILRLVSGSWLLDQHSTSAGPVASLGEEWTNSGTNDLRSAGLTPWPLIQLLGTRSVRLPRWRGATDQPRKRGCRHGQLLPSSTN